MRQRPKDSYAVPAAVSLQCSSQRPVAPPQYAYAQPVAPPQYAYAQPVAPPHYEYAQSVAPPHYEYAQPVAPPQYEYAQPVAPPQYEYAQPVAPPQYAYAQPVAPRENSHPQPVAAPQYAYPQQVAPSQYSYAQAMSHPENSHLQLVTSSDYVYPQAVAPPQYAYAQPVAPLQMAYQQPAVPEPAPPQLYVRQQPAAPQAYLCQQTGAPLQMPMQNQQPAGIPAYRYQQPAATQPWPVQQPAVPVYHAYQQSGVSRQQPQLAYQQPVAPQQPYEQQHFYRQSSDQQVYMEMTPKTDSIPIELANFGSTMGFYRNGCWYNSELLQSANNGNQPAILAPNQGQLRLAMKSLSCNDGFCSTTNLQPKKHVKQRIYKSRINLRRTHRTYIPGLQRIGEWLKSLFELTDKRMMKHSANQAMADQRTDGSSDLEVDSSNMVNDWQQQQQEYQEPQSQPMSEQSYNYSIRSMEFYNSHTAAQRQSYPAYRYVPPAQQQSYPANRYMPPAQQMGPPQIRYRRGGGPPYAAYAARYGRQWQPTYNQPGHASNYMPRMPRNYVRHTRLPYMGQEYATPRGQGRIFRHKYRNPQPPFHVRSNTYERRAPLPSRMNQANYFVYNEQQYNGPEQQYNGHESEMPQMHQNYAEYAEGDVFANDIPQQEYAAPDHCLPMIAYAEEVSHEPVLVEDAASQPMTADNGHSQETIDRCQSQADEATEPNTQACVQMNHNQELSTDEPAEYSLSNDIDSQESQSPLQLNAAFPTESSASPCGIAESSDAGTLLMNVQLRLPKAGEIEPDYNPESHKPNMAEHSMPIDESKRVQRAPAAAGQSTFIPGPTAPTVAADVKTDQPSLAQAVAQQSSELSPPVAAPDATYSYGNVLKNHSIYGGLQSKKANDWPSLPTVSNDLSGQKSSCSSRLKAMQRSRYSAPKPIADTVAVQDHSQDSNCVNMDVSKAPAAEYAQNDVSNVQHHSESVEQQVSVVVTQKAAEKRHKPKWKKITAAILEKPKDDLDDETKVQQYNEYPIATKTTASIQKPKDAEVAKYKSTPAKAKTIQCDVVDVQDIPKVANLKVSSAAKCQQKSNKAAASLPKETERDKDDATMPETKLLETAMNNEAENAKLPDPTASNIAKSNQKTKKTASPSLVEVKQSQADVIKTHGCSSLPESKISKVDVAAQKHATTAQTPAGSSERKTSSETANVQRDATKVQHNSESYEGNSQSGQMTSSKKSKKAKRASVLDTLLVSAPLKTGEAVEAFGNGQQNRSKFKAKPSKQERKFLKMHTKSAEQEKLPQNPPENPPKNPPENPPENPPQPTQEPHVQDDVMTQDNFRILSDIEIYPELMTRHVIQLMTTNCTELMKATIGEQAADSTKLMVKAGSSPFLSAIAQASRKSDYNTPYQRSQMCRFAAKAPHVSDNQDEPTKTNDRASFFDFIQEPGVRQTFLQHAENIKTMLNLNIDFDEDIVETYRTEVNIKCSITNFRRQWQKSLKKIKLKI